MPRAVFKCPSDTIIKLVTFTCFLTRNVRYVFAQRYFPATPAAERSLSASASGHAIVVATLSAAGGAQAGLLGAAAVAAWISSGCGFIGAALFGSSSLKANVSAMGALQPANLLSYRGTARERQLTHRCGTHPRRLDPCRRDCADRHTSTRFSCSRAETNDR